MFLFRFVDFGIRLLGLFFVEGFCLGLRFAEDVLNSFLLGLLCSRLRSEPWYLI